MYKKRRLTYWRWEKKKNVLLSFCACLFLEVVSIYLSKLVYKKRRLTYWRWKKKRLYYYFLVHVFFLRLSLFNDFEIPTITAIGRPKDVRTNLRGRAAIRLWILFCMKIRLWIYARLLRWTALELVLPGSALEALLVLSFSFLSVSVWPKKKFQPSKIVKRFEIFKIKSKFKQDQRCNNYFNN